MGNSETLWAGKFGDDYVDRNRASFLERNALHLMGKILARTRGVTSVLEYGANTGVNLRAVAKLCPGVELAGNDINSRCCGEMRDSGVLSDVFEGSMWDVIPKSRKWDLVFTNAVLMHCNQLQLAKAYEQIESNAGKYVLLAEHYSYEELEIPYRGNEGVLFRRDFAGLFMDKYSGQFDIVDYGFQYHRDPMFPRPDFTWFLLERVAR